jgi:hypothetical protein
VFFLIAEKISSEDDSGHAELVIGVLNFAVPE